MNKGKEKGRDALVLFAMGLFNCAVAPYDGEVGIVPLVVPTARLDRCFAVNEHGGALGDKGGGANGCDRCGYPNRGQCRATAEGLPFDGCYRRGKLDRGERRTI